MALIAALTADSAVEDALRSPPDTAERLAPARSWARLGWLLRERPVTVVVLDSDTLAAEVSAVDAVAELTLRYPSVGIVFLYRPRLDPLTLFRLGRAGVDGLALVGSERMSASLRPAAARAARLGTRSLVLRAIGRAVPGSMIDVVGLALDGVQIGWGAEELAQAVGLSRAHLGVRLREVGLPPPGHLLLWAKLLHVGRWLGEPGRSAQSISRQLDYSSGAALRRVVRVKLGETPSGVRERGGFSWVLSRFLDECGIRDSVGATRSVA